MASSAERRVIKVAAAVQGIVLVTFPAASTIFTDPQRYGLSTSQYGGLFLPQALTAITSALLGASLSRRVGTRRLYLVGLAANFVSMLLLLVSAVVEHDQSVAYAILLVATASLGIGFGLTVPALNTFTAEFYPDGIDRAILVLNALLGVGTALAPVFVAAFVGLGFWWGLPLMSAILLAVLTTMSVRLPLRTTDLPATDGSTREGGIPRLFWVFAGFAVLYGICETMNGNWASIDMTKHLGSSTTEASIALTAFWASVTLGRLLFAAVRARFSAPRIYHLLPFVLAAAFVAIAVLPTDEPVLGIVAFALAGLGCSALLPLTISFGQENLTAISAAVAGGVIAFYQVGYGIAAFGAGPLQSAGVSLPTLYGLTALVAVAMGALSYAVTHHRAEPATLHPRPT
ncbi:MAG TPA: MFS transporter [Acidimicrobiales bacterium]